jgi:tryptophan-rich sensory protein
VTTTARTPGTAAQIGALAGFAVAVTAAAALGALGVAGTAGEYASLDTPSWAPPSDVFGPVWTVLYALMAVSGWLVWRKVGGGTEVAVFAGQLVLNAAWTPLFFGAGNYGLALVDIVVLWLAIGATIALFHRVSRPAAWLLVPYWAWVTFATALNWSIWRMNP